MSFALITRGQGLGKNGDGIVKHIKIDKKADDGGVGIDAVAAEQRDQVCYRYL